MSSKRQADSLAKLGFLSEWLVEFVIFCPKIFNGNRRESTL
jgi:hypothetical protein